jgi:hypothetical protein
MTGKECDGKGTLGPQHDNAILSSKQPQQGPDLRSSGRGGQSHQQNPPYANVTSNDRQALQSTEAQLNVDAEHQARMLHHTQRKCQLHLQRSTVANGCGWHAGMKVIDILHQLNNIYGKPNSSALEVNDNLFRSPYLAADAHKVLFR